MIRCKNCCSDCSFLYCSVTELAESGSNGALCVGGVLEGHVVLGAPGELSAEACVDALLVVRLGSDVTDFLLARLKGLVARVELGPLHHGEGGDVTDVAHRLELVQVLRVVHEVEHEVVLHGDVESLHLLRLGATGLADSAVNSVFGFHEGFVLGLDLVDDTWGVDGITMSVPVDSLECRVGLILVVVVEESLQLSVGVTGVLVRGGGSESLQPDSGKVTA